MACMRDSKKPWEDTVARRTFAVVVVTFAASFVGALPAVVLLGHFIP